jgi:hypothetical protein
MQGGRASQAHTAFGVGDGRSRKVTDALAFSLLYKFKTKQFLQLFEFISSGFFFIGLDSIEYYIEPWFCLYSEKMLTCNFNLPNGHFWDMFKGKDL